MLCALAQVSAALWLGVVDLPFGGTRWRSAEGNVFLWSKWHLSNVITLVELLIDPKGLILEAIRLLCEEPPQGFSRETRRRKVKAKHLPIKTVSRDLWRRHVMGCENSKSWEEDCSPINHLYGKKLTIASELSTEGHKSYLWNSDAEAPKIELRDFPNTTTSVHTMWLVTVSPTQYLWFTLSCKYSSWHLLHQYLQVKVSRAIPTTGLSLHHTVELSSGKYCQ